MTDLERRSLLFARGTAVFATALLGALLIYALAAAIAHADDGLDLARAGLHEAGRDVTGDELAAMWAVANRLPRRRPVCAQMQRFCAGHTPRAPALLRLRRSTIDPGLLAVADAIVRGTITHRCSAEPQAWGMAHGVDLARALRFRWFRVRCGTGVRNLFWRWTR